MSGKLGDIQPKSIDQLETYFDMNRQGVVLPRRKWIVAPTWAPPAIPGVEALQTMLEKHALPRSWQLLMDFWQKAQCGTYFVKSPDWLEPPLLADIHGPARVGWVRPLRDPALDPAAGL